MFKMAKFYFHISVNALYKVVLLNPLSLPLLVHSRSLLHVSRLECNHI